MLKQKQYNKSILNGNLAREGNTNTTLFFIIEEAKESILDFPQGTVKVL